MKKIEKLKWDFFCELDKVSKEHENRAFKIGLYNNLDDPKDFKCDLIDNLHRNGAIEILDEYFGNATHKGKPVNIAKGANLRMFGYKPIEMTVRLKYGQFKRFYDDQQDIIKTNGKTLVSCKYNGDKGSVLNISDTHLRFKGRTSMILYYLYQARKADNLQTYITYNDFIKTEHPNDKHYVGSILFGQAVEDINKRVKKEDGNYINSVVDIIQNGNQCNTYKWNPKILKK